MIGSIKYRATSSKIRSKTKTNRNLLARVFPPLAPVTLISFELSLVHWIVWLCFDWVIILVLVLRHSIENRSNRELDRLPNSNNSVLMSAHISNYLSLPFNIWAYCYPPSLDGMLVLDIPPPLLRFAYVYLCTWIEKVRCGARSLVLCLGTTQQQKPDSNHQPSDRKFGKLTIKP